MKAKSASAGKYADGHGLWLVKRNKTAGKWILRITVSGKRREMGLGPWPDVSIAEARFMAAEARKTLRNGEDPIVKRAKKRAVKKMTVSEAVEGCFKARQAELKGDGKAGRWMSPLKNHIVPKLGNIPIEDINQHFIVDTLGPIWHEKPDVARKALNRTNITLKHAAALGLDVDLQATMKARALLGKQRHEVEHIPSLPYSEAPEFYQWLKTKTGVAAQALRFLILTVARTSEIRFARFDEIEEDIWILSGERTKSGQSHRIPLTEEALELVSNVRKSTRGDHLFTSLRGNPISDVAMSVFMKREGYVARPHGFRATFRTWVEEQSEAPYEVKEAALGHKVDSDIVRAYQRSDRIKQRRELMEAWALFLIKPHQGPI